jgi:hypothetical protein
MAQSYFYFGDPLKHKMASNYSQDSKNRDKIPGEAIRE